MSDLNGETAMTLIVDETRKASAPELTIAMHKGLDSRFPAPEWLVAREVPCASRQIDAVVVRMWADAVVHGFEVKASRSDWLREMANPNKADVALPFVDYFNLVVADSTVAKPDEVPDHWGLLVLQRNGTLRASKAATMLRPSVEGRRFWAAMIRRAWQGSEDREFEKRLSDAGHEGYERGFKYGRDSERDKVSREDEELAGARRLREAFGWESGVILARAPEIKAWLDGDRRQHRLKNLVSTLRETATELENVMGSSGDAAK
jgi:hypothetical protein